MSAHAVDLQQAPAQLSELVDEAARTGEVILTRSGQPVAKIVPFTPDRPRRTFGSARGLITVPDDFDAPLEDFRDYM